MPRYIDADKFIEWLDIGHLRSPSEVCYCEGDVKTMIDLQPTADVVEVVRCKDCINNPGYVRTKGLVWCRKFRGDVHPNGYCSYGEQKGGSDDNS